MNRSFENPIREHRLWITPKSADHLNEMIEHGVSPKERGNVYMFVMLAMNLAHKLVQEQIDEHQQ